MTRSENQVAMITGAAGNLGQATARAFAATGSRTVLVDREPDRLPRIFPELSESADHFLATSVDLTEPPAVQTMVAEALRRFGRIDALVNCAGGWRGGTPVHNTEIEAFDFLMKLNVHTILVPIQAIVPHMLERGEGCIINVASRSALSGGARNGAYAAAKSAVVRLTESMSAELKKQGIQVNCVLPSTIDTPENRESMPKADHSRWVQPEAIADVIVFLASDAARAIHGAAIPVYGLG